MTPFRWLHELPLDGPERIVVLGVFDGVHRGHQALLGAARAEADRTGARVTAMTFHPHPAAIFSPARVPAALGTLPERAALLRRFGAEDVVVAAFDPAFAAMTPEAFVRTVLIERLRVQAAIVGEDFHFGCDRSGDTGALRDAGARHGFRVRVVSPVFVDGVPARSTAIRHLLAGGRVMEASRLLGYPYVVTGDVVRGRQLGRTLGFPTANLATAPGIQLPGPGVYAGTTVWAGTRYRAAISVGVNATIDPLAPSTVEAHLLDGFDQEIYGNALPVAFHRWLRAMERFASVEALKERIGLDVALTARQIEQEAASG